MGRAVLMSLLLSQRKAGPRRIRNRKEICVGKRNFIHILPRGMYRLTLVRRASLPVTDSKTQTKKGRPKGRASSMSLYGVGMYDFVVISNLILCDQNKL